MRLFPAIGTWVIGGALAAAGAWGMSGAARAGQGEPWTAQSPAETQDDLQRGLAAQQEAQAARERAARLENEGGQAYKTRQVQSAERTAAIHEQAANEYFARAGVPSCQGIAPPPPPPSPELKAAQDRLDNLREQGGWAYKSGAVRQAQIEVERLTPAPSTP